MANPNDTLAAILAEEQKQTDLLAIISTAIHGQRLNAQQLEDLLTKATAKTAALQVLADALKPVP